MAKETEQIKKAIDKIKDLSIVINYGFILKDTLVYMMDDIYKLCDEIKEN